MPQPDEKGSIVLEKALFLRRRTKRVVWTTPAASLFEPRRALKLMTSKQHGVGNRAASFTSVIVFVAHLGCGKTADLLERRGEDGGNADGMALDSGTSGSDGTSRSAAMDSGAGDNTSRGGSNENQGGTSGNAGEGGTGGSGGLSGAGGMSGDGSWSSVDPHAAERKQLAADYCALLEQHPCLWFGGVGPGSNDQQTECRQQVEVVQYSTWAQSCWEEWVAAMECATGAYGCPCEDNDCVLAMVDTHPAPPGCEAERDALVECSHPREGITRATGSAGECEYFRSSTGVCGMNCLDEQFGWFGANCEGPPESAQSCNCTLNGVFLCDEGLAGGCSPWLAEDCADAAQIVADGYCRQMVDCCFTWINDGNPWCSCTADPSAAGFDSCEAAAAAAGGEVVDVCPRHREPAHGFPQPG